MNEATKMRIRACFDKQLIWSAGQSVRFLVAEVVGPDRGHSTPPVQGLNLALVIDASGSMGGAKLAAAKQASIGVIAALREEHVLSVISFSSDVVHHVTTSTMTPEAKRRAMAAVEGIHVRDQTNLADGWLAGAEAVSASIDTAAPSHRHVVVLSDGQANRGEVDPSKLAIISENLRERRVYTSTVGIGDDYSTAQLREIALWGGGRMHRAETPADIVEVVMGELNEMISALTQDANIQLDLPSGTKVDVLSSFPMRIAGGKANCHLGTFGAGVSRNVVFKLTCPPGSEGDRLTVTSTLSWRVSAIESVLRSEEHKAALLYAAGKANNTQSRDIAVSQLVAQVWQSVIVQNAVEFNRSGAHDEGSKYVAKELKYFEKYCADLPDTELLVAELKRVLQQMAQPWEESSRKEIELHHYKSSRSEHDHRSGPRPGWNTFLPPNR